mmetsp:Transcript_121520/g.389117  ORF Transcript_121520/g.389117 Transcript_121520/m.389117 type:complete len:394 (-) Transcript_121520:72-1253(-)
MRPLVLPRAPLPQRAARWLGPTEGWTGRWRKSCRGCTGSGALAKRRRRARVQGIPETARASKRSKEPEIRKVFDLVRGSESSAEAVSLEDLYAFIADYLGFGQAEVELFFDSFGNSGKGATFESFSQGYALLNPFMLAPLKGPIRSREVIVRKSGSLGGLQGSSQQVNLEYLEDSEIYVCASTAQAFVDDCKRSVVLFAPCESSVFVRNCEDCIFWMAVQQLRTRDCKRCTFYLYSKTEPVIEESQDLAFAPWCAKYPGCSAQFEKARFDPQRNLWNAVFDFTGKPDRSNWCILPLNEVRSLRVELPDERPDGSDGIVAEPDGPCPEVTHAMLCADPVSSEDCGQSMGNIPQTRPNPPQAPSGPVKVPVLVFRDSGRTTREVGASNLDAFPTA